MLVLLDPAAGAAATDDTGAGDVMGFAQVVPTHDDDNDPEHVAELTLLYLAPAAWRPGGGALLLDAATGAMAAAGFGSATLWALDTNARARGFCERHGWRLDGAAKLHDWGAFTATDVRYARTLT